MAGVAFPSELVNPWSGKPWEPEPGTEKEQALKEELIASRLSADWDPQTAFDWVQERIHCFKEDGILQWERFELERASPTVFFTPLAYVRFCFWVVGHAIEPESE